MKVPIGCGLRRLSFQAPSSGSSNSLGIGGNCHVGSMSAGGAGRPRMSSAELPVGGHEGVEKDQLANPVTDVCERSGHHHAAVAEPEQDDVVEVLVEHRVDDVGHVGRQRHGR